MTGQLVDGIRVERCRDAHQVAEIVENRQPRAIEQAAALHEHGIGRRHRVWIARLADEIVGLVSIVNVCRDRWMAAPLVLDPRAGAAIASTIDASPAWLVSGSLRDLQPLTGLRRTRRVSPSVGAFFSVPAPIPDFRFEDRRIRPANAGDRAALEELYLGFELDPASTAPRARRYLHEALARGPILVAEVGRSIVGAIRVEGRTDQYLHWGGQTVLPGHRGTGLGIALILHTFAASRHLGLGACAFRADSNPLSCRQLEPLLGTTLEADIWGQIPLEEPTRFRGHGRLRRLLERLEGGPLERRRPETGHRALI